MAEWLAIDIGGANLKLADGRGFAVACAFELWKHPELLARELRTLLAESPAASHLAITMTGELADCFPDKAHGVHAIIDAVQEVADNRHTRIYLTDGKLVSPQVAMRRPMEAAASNWHALGAFAARHAAQGAGLLLDIGSTTVDILPLADGQLRNAARDDTGRLMSGELVYTGIDRTPVCALIEDAPYRGGRCRVAAELFATTLDAYLLSGDARENEQRLSTADGRPATKRAARARLGRMIGAPDDFNHRDALAIAMHVIDQQVERLTEAAREVLARLPQSPQCVVVSGHGDYLAARMLNQLQLDCRVVRLRSVIGRVAARCAPAHALAVLAREGL